MKEDKEEFLKELRGQYKFVRDTISAEGFWTTLHRGQTHLYLSKDTVTRAGEEEIKNLARKIFGQRLDKFGLSGWITEEPFKNCYSIELPPMKYENNNKFVKKWSLFLKRKITLIDTLKEAEDKKFYDLIKSVKNPPSQTL